MSSAFEDQAANLKTILAQMLCRIESMNQDNHRQTRKIILDKISKGNESLKFDLRDQSIISSIEMLDVSDESEQRLRASIKEGIIQSLIYPSMTDRYEDVIEAHPSTFEWAFRNSTDTELSWSNLSEWLQFGQKTYWVCGKAGSGKSTFMKHIFDAPKTKEYLTVWAGKTPFCLSSFFFWNSGTREQKSQRGFLRSLIFQVFSQFPELVATALPQYWSTLYSKGIQQELSADDFKVTWSLQQLMATFRVIIHQKSVPAKICFLVDGLDEFDGDHEEMGRLFNEISSSKNVKVCLSSRPLVVFEDLFSTCPMLRLQNLTYRDIDRYVRDKLNSSVAYQRLADNQPETAPALIREIVKKADGVFLWVELVVQSLLTGIRNRDELSDLWERLKLMPRELEPLYSRLLDLVEPIYMTWVSKAMQILRANHDLQNRDDVHKGRNAVSTLTIFAFVLAIREELSVQSFVEGEQDQAQEYDKNPVSRPDRVTLPSIGQKSVTAQTFVNLKIQKNV